MLRARSLSRLLLASLALGGWSLPAAAATNAPASNGATMQATAKSVPTARAAHRETAVFAMGCFWSAEAAFEKQPGVISSVSGYCGGDVEHPTYEHVSEGTTGHLESVQVTFDPTKTSYEKMLDLFWHNIDPTQADGMFCDQGVEYQTAIFFASDAQKRAAYASREAIDRSGVLRAPIVVEMRPAKPFRPAEEYHQDFFRKDPLRYKGHHLGCGGVATLKKIWGDAAGRPLVD